MDTGPKPSASTTVTDGKGRSFVIDVSREAIEAIAGSGMSDDDLDDWVDANSDKLGMLASKIARERKLDTEHVRLEKGDLTDWS